MITKSAIADLPSPAPRSADPATLAAEIIERLTYSIGKDAKVAKPHDWMTATILVIRDRVIDRWMESTRQAYETGGKRVYYLSLEFLIGRLTRDAVSNLEMLDEVRVALTSLGVDFDAVAALEPDAALGNGGLGRLAACFMESMATVDIPAYGYGIRYVHGLFRQQMSDGWQVELPETWLANGNPWEFQRRESAYEIGFGGSVDIIGNGSEETQRCIWKPQERMIATAYDTPVVGWRAKRVNTLRLWTAQPIDPILLDAFNAGDHIGALKESNKAEALARVLYPADQTPAGQELRLRQEYFFLLSLAAGHPAPPPAAVRRSAIAARQGRHSAQRHPSGGFRRRTDATPDRRPPHGFRSCLGYHLQDLQLHQPHALARSAGKLAGTAVRAASAAPHAACLRHQTPRCCAMRARSAATTRSRSVRFRLIDEGGDRRVRMGNLAFLGSHSINGVSALHTELMKQTVFFRSARTLSRTHQQQDQRHHAAALADAVQSRPVLFDPRGDRR